MAFYPIIKDETIMTLQIVTKSLKANSAYLDSPDCPYSESVKQFFRLSVEQSTVTIDIFEGADEVDVIDRQIQKALSDLDAMGLTMLSAETNEKINYFKTKAMLIEKLIGLKERIFNLKEVSEFRNIMLEAIEQLLNKDQITEIMKRLDGVLGTGETK